jgi:MFS family permease
MTTKLPSEGGQPAPAAAAVARTELTSPWTAFHHKAFTVVWIATVVASIGSWMYSAASGWLMTSLNPDPVMVSMVQVATSLPMFLFALPAGALADIVDRRQFLIVVEVLITVISAVFALVIWRGMATPVILLVFTFLAGVAAALEAPAWQAIVPALVPKCALGAAVVTNGVGVNISRAIGPALAGIIVVAWGIAAPFWLNAISNVGVVAALIWWRSPQKVSRTLPAERFINANRDGLRYAKNDPPLRATLIRAVSFFLFASTYWALLPLVSRTQIGGGAELYGLLLGGIGVGALVGAYLLPWLGHRLGADGLVAAGTLGTALSLLLYGLAHEPFAALGASLLAGLSWICVLSTLNMSVQAALPEWVRARGLAVFVVFFFGALSIGSALWGYLAGVIGLANTHFVAAGGILVTLPLTWRWKLLTALGADLAPSMHWPAPIGAHEVDADRGPVMVMVEYRIDPGNRKQFLAALDRVEQERRRDGAYAWSVFEDAAEEGRMIETFLVESWIEHLRQHERVTNADRLIEEKVNRYQIHGTPKVTHLIAADADRVHVKEMRSNSMHTDASALQLGTSRRQASDGDHDD